MKTYFTTRALFFLTFLLLASYKMGQSAYWQGWHQGKSDQFQADQLNTVDGESQEVQ